MLRNICYTLMAGGIVSSVWKMQNNPRQFVPDTEPEAILETVVSSDAEQMADLLTWVGTIEKTSGLHPDDQAELFSHYLTPDFETPGILEQLEIGMSREEVRSLLGDPITIIQNDRQWTYQTARIMFNKNRMQGWVEIDADLTLQAANRKMQSWRDGPEIWESLHRQPKLVPNRTPIIRSTVAQQTSAGRRSNYRSSVDRIYKSINRARRHESKLYHKPQYLSNMFPSREVGRRERQRRVGRHNSRVQSYRKNSG